MWIYCNPNGNIVSVCYSRSIMQGNSFSVTVCFPDNQEFLNQALAIHFTVNGRQITVGNISGGNGGAIKAFPGVNPDSYVTNQDIGAFVKGRKYVMYDIEVPSAYGVTSVYGKVPFYISMSTYENIGSGNIYVQKSYGNETPSGITDSEYSDIMNGLRKSMFFTEFPMSFNVNASGKISIYGWRNVGYIFGKFTLNELPDTAEDEYIPIAESDPIVCDTLPCVTVFGTGSNGEDYEFKLIPNETAVYDEATGIPTGERKTVFTLFLNPKSYASDGTGSEIYISGTFEFSGYLIGFSDGEEDSTEYTIRQVNATAKTGEKAGVSLSFGKNGDNVDTMSFDFTIPVVQTQTTWITEIREIDGGNIHFDGAINIIPTGTLYLVTVNDITGIIKEGPNAYPELSVLLSYDGEKLQNAVSPVFVRNSAATMKIFYALEESDYKNEKVSQPEYLIFRWMKRT